MKDVAQILTRQVLPLSIGLGTVGLLASRADRALDALRERISDLKVNLTLDSKIDKIISLMPSLIEYDRERLKLYYKQLHHFAPDVAANELAAAAYIKHAITYDQGMPLATFESITRTQKHMERPATRRGVFGPALMAGGAAKVEESPEVSLDFRPFFSDK